ncbi:MAG: hypothetical protein IPH84_07280 [Bacteroidales bacterium]|nr:hypothetical protein [Bacteroidales bacterium]
MIHFLSHDQVNSEKWDECIQHAINGNLYGYSWFLDLVCPEWCALVEDDYVRVMPLPAWKKFGITYLLQPYFTQQLGLYSQQALNQEVLDKFIRSIPRRFLYMDFNLNKFNTINQFSLDCSLQVNYELDLIHPYEKLKSQYSENLSRNLKKAEKHDLTLVRSLKPEVIIDLFRLNKGSSIKALKEDQYQLLSRLIYAMISRGICQVWGAIDENNQVVAGIIWAYSHQKAVFLFSALSDLGKEKGVMPWMIDTFIHEKAGNSITLDFEGSNDENLARFYASFGSEKTFYPRLKMNNLPVILRPLLSVYRKFREI